MLVQLIFWVISTAILFVTGILSEEIINQIYRTKSSFSFYSILLLGFTILTLIVGYLSVFKAIDATVKGAILILGFGYSAIHWRHLVLRVKSIIREFDIRSLVFLLGISISLAYAGLKGPASWIDSGIYHIQNIKWISEYKVIPGLGNLHSRFAFNSMFFPISALFELKIGADQKQIIYSLNALFTVITCLRLFEGIRNKLRVNPSSFSVLYLFILVPYLAIAPRLSHTPSPDIICAVILTHIFLDFLENKQAITPSSFLIYLIITFTCVSIKLSSGFLLLTLIPLLIWHTKSSTIRPFLFAF